MGFVGLMVALVCVLVLCVCLCSLGNRDADKGIYTDLNLESCISIKSFCHYVVASLTLGPKLSLRCSGMELYLRLKIKGVRALTVRILELGNTLTSELRLVTLVSGISIIRSSAF